MTLEECIEVLWKRSKCKLNSCLNFDCSNCEFAIDMKQAPTITEILSYFEELKVTRKAFDLACKRLEILDKKLGGTCQLNSEQYHDSILKMAREQYDT